MTTLRKAVTALGLLLALAAAGARQAWAAAPTPTPFADEDLLVSFTAALSVKIDGIQYSSRTLGPLAAGQTFVPASSATVTNDSSGLTEKFQLTTVDASPASVTPLWSVGLATGSQPGGGFCAANQGDPSCPGLDTYALQALFISSSSLVGCPGSPNGDWDTYASTVAATATTYVAGYFSDTSVAFGDNNGGTGNPDQTAANKNGNMFAVSGGTDGRGKRGLCVRLTMPSASSTVSQHTVRLTITAVVGS